MADSFKAYWKANKPKGYVGKNKLGKNPSPEEFRAFQQASAQRKTLKGLYQAGASPKQLNRAQRILKKTGYGKTGNPDAQNAAFARMPLMRKAYMAQNNLIEKNGRVFSGSDIVKQTASGDYISVPKFLADRLPGGTPASQVFAKLKPIKKKPPKK